MQETVLIDKLVHGGQGLGTLADGRKVFVWNALPGETVRLRLIKTKKSYAEAIAEEVVKASPERTAPSEANYLATSPWQMMTFTAENEYKHDIALELFAREKAALPPAGPTLHGARQWHYRNKMEYSFWGDDAGLHLALHQRGSHGKQIVSGSQLAMPAIDAAAGAVCRQLDRLGVRAGDLKTVIVRCSQPRQGEGGQTGGEAVAALFTKREDFSRLTLPEGLKGLRVYFSNPKSPASVPTRLLYELGDCLLQDDLLGQPFVYDVDSFFQVNVPVFEKALLAIRQQVDAPDLTDMYAGVGSIGLSVARERVKLVELDPASVRMAAQNADALAAARGLFATEVIEASAEKALDFITRDRPVIFDPPRAGLHERVVARVLEARPPQIIYLSCNPATQARDLARLHTAYKTEHFQIFNFFPRTPHIETLAVLRPT